MRLRSRNGSRKLLRTAGRGASTPITVTVCWTPTRPSADRCKRRRFPHRDALEPNDDDTLATRLQKVGSATIVPEGDVDWYVTSLRWPALFRFDVVAPRYNAYTGPNLRPVAELYDANLNRLATDEPDAQRARLAFRLPAGLYYLRVANGYGARSAGAYSVSLSVRRSRGIAAEPMPLTHRLACAAYGLVAARSSLAQDARLPRREVDDGGRDARQHLRSSTAAAASRNSSGTSSRRPGPAPPLRFALVAARPLTRASTSAVGCPRYGTRTPIVSYLSPVSQLKRRAGFGRTSVYGPGSRARAITPARPRSSGTSSKSISTLGASIAVG